MKRSERELREMMRHALIECLRGAQSSEEKETVEESLPEGGKRKVERVVRKAPPDMDALKMYMTMVKAEKDEKTEREGGSGVRMVHLVPRPEDDGELTSGGEDG